MMLGSVTIRKSSLNNTVITKLTLYIIGCYIGVKLVLLLIIRF